jgi:ribosomal protein S18 acetylase RimI-like enzyme
VADEIKIRVAVGGDAGVLAVLCADVQDLHVHARPEVFKPVDRAALQRWFAGEIAAGAATIWIAYVGETPAGYAVVDQHHRPENVFCFECRWCEIEQLGVLPLYRRRGIARALIDHVVQSAMADGVSNVELNTWSFNDGARRAFKELGFAEKHLRFERSATPRK